MARNQLGFTLIELLVAITLSVILIAAASGLFFTTLRSDSKKNFVSELKDNGDYAMNQVEFLLRNAIALELNAPGSPVCTTGMSRIALRSIDDSVTTISAQAGRIASESAYNTKYLTGSHLSVSNLSFNCQQSSPNIGTFIKISFTMSYATNSGYFSESGTENFATTINIRSF
jgi:type IV pilus assembly protein PilW